MNNKRMRYLTGLIGMVVILSVVLLIRWRQEADQLLVTLLDEPITRDAYEAGPEPSSDETREMRARLDAAALETWTECVQWRPLRERIHHTLIQWFQEQHDLMPTRREVEEYVRLVYIQPILVYFPDGDSPPVPDEHSDEWQVAEDELIRWKLNNTLQDVYGGRMAFSQRRERALALDARERLFRDCEEQGVLRFHKDELRRLFYTCLELDGVWQVDDYVSAKTDDTLTVLREHPAARQLRIAANRYAVMMEGQEAADLLDGMEWPAPWSGAR